MSQYANTPQDATEAWRPSVLVLDDEWSTLEVIRDSLAKHFAVEVASRADEALRLMEQKPFDVVLTDVRMPDMDGLSVVGQMKARHPGAQYILMTAFSDIEDTIRAIRLGVADYLRKPFTIGEVRHALNRCLEQRRLRRQNGPPRDQGPAASARLTALDPKMRQLCALADTVAPTDVTVLIGGETGTGKSILARAIHQASPRREKPYVEINCAAIPEALIESELFGHERGSFTGAIARKIGRVEAADGGTLFLDEVGEMSLDMQAKLLRFLQEFTFERVGGAKKQSADVRVIAATNRNLREAVASGVFREDLFYRLHVIELVIPPLRDRPLDQAPLAEAFLRRFAEKYGRADCRFGPQVQRQIAAHHWPGNVRELEHAVERAVILARGSEIARLELEHAGQRTEASRADAAPEAVAAPPAEIGPLLDGRDLNQFVDDCQRQYLAGLLAKHNGRIGLVAKAAGVNPKTLYLKMTRLGLRKEDYRGERASDKSSRDAGPFVA